MSVDLSSIEQAVIGLCGVTITVFGSLALRALAAKFHVQLTASQTLMFDDALSKAATYGVVAANDEIKAKGWDHPEVKNAILEKALTYVVAKFPDALAGVGLSNKSDDPENIKAITAALERVIPSATLAASESPSTPPAALAMSSASGATKPLQNLVKT
jgi:hypothetical protein